MVERHPMKTKYDYGLNKTIKFQPISRRHFVFNLKGLDAFLVKRIEFPPYIKPSKSWQKTDREILEESLSHKKLIVHLHCAIMPSTHVQITEMIETGLPKEANLLFLDPVGSVICTYAYSGLELDRVDYSDADYDSSDLSWIKLTISYNNMHVKS
jgi:hypothetical protein